MTRSSPSRPDEPGLLGIGAFARASLLSVKALRAYHEAGVLVPARVDPLTGYRSYEVGQLSDAAVLRRLRDVDLPLAEVRRVLDARDPEVTRTVLAAHAEVMQARLDRVEQSLERLSASLARPVEQTPVHLRDDPAQLTLEQRAVVGPDDYAGFLAAAYGELWRVLVESDLQLAGPAGALYPLAEDDVSEVVAYLPVDRAVALPEDRGQVGYGEVPGARVAVLTHHGSYDEIGETYRQLGAWVATYATPCESPVRERYVVGPAQTADPSTLRTDICWPVAGTTPATCTTSAAPATPATPGGPGEPATDPSEDPR